VPKEDGIKEPTNEGGFFDLLVGEPPQFELPIGEWARDAADRFQGDDENGQKMGAAKPGITNPRPFKDQADPNYQLTDHPITDIGQMKRYHHICHIPVPHT